MNFSQLLKTPKNGSPIDNYKKCLSPTISKFSPSENNLVTKGCVSPQAKSTFDENILEEQNLKITDSIPTADNNQEGNYLIIIKLIIL